MQSPIAAGFIIIVSMFGLFAPSFPFPAVLFFILLSILGIFFSAEEVSSYFELWYSKKYRQHIVYIPLTVSAPAVVLSGQAHSLYNHCSYGRLAILCIVSIFIFFLLHKIAIKDFTFNCLFPKRWKTFGLIALLWSIGTVIHINSNFGGKKSVIYRTRIIDVKSNSSDPSTYTLTLEAFKEQWGGSRIKVSASFLKTLDNQNFFPLRVYKGCLGIEYYSASYTK